AEQRQGEIYQVYLEAVPLTQRKGIQSYHRLFSWFDAAERNDTDTLKSLLATKDNMELRREDGKTALMLAAAHGHKTLVPFLLSAGAVIGEWDRGGETALMLAAANGHESVVNLLLNAGAEVD